MSIRILTGPVVGLLLVFLQGSCAFANRATIASSEEFKFPTPCTKDESRRKSRSEELQKIVQADQADRKNWSNLTPEEMAEVVVRDVVRRKRVGEIFGEGCFSKPEDYGAAALVFQHGDSPDHFYQVFVWAKRGVELGDAKQKDLMAIGIDRYLVNIGKKQLFGSQASQIMPGSCFCLQQVERTFPDERRTEFLRPTLRRALDWVDSLNLNKKCAPASECPEPLTTTPEGSIPGFW